MKRVVYIRMVVMISVILVAVGAWAQPPELQCFPHPLRKLIKRVKALEVAVGDLQAENTRQQRIINDLSNRLADAEEALDDAESVLALGPYVFVNQDAINGLVGPHLIFEGVNVHIRSGSESTNDNIDQGEELTGLGNLMVGYNAERGSGGDRSGSHNVILGDLQNFSSFGGLVAGRQNTISGEYATVTAGHSNTASGYAAHVSGGWANKASFHYCSVSGGTLNEASGWYSCVSGGYDNLASGRYASISGGQHNTASGSYSSVSGGYDRRVSGTYEWGASSLHAADPDGAVTIESDSDITLMSKVGALNLSGLRVNLESTFNTEIVAGAVMNISSVALMDLRGSPIFLNVTDPGNQRWAARILDPVSGFLIAGGCPTVLIGD
jgi:hypothetical protein